jgi:hypothetical protein
MFDKLVACARGAERIARAIGWEKQVRSARGFKRAGRHSEYAIIINGMEVRKKRHRGFKKRPRGFK